MSDLNLSVEHARCIINEMRSRGTITDPMPETDEAQIDLGTKIVQVAQREYSKGNTNPAITVVLNILKLAAGDPALTGQDRVPAAEEAPTPTEAPSEPQAAVQAPQAAPPGGTDMREQVMGRVTGFPLPAMIPDPGPFPADLTALSMTEIRRLAGEWNRIYGTAMWNLSLEETDLMRAEQVWERKRGEALQGIERKDEDGKARLAAQIDADVNADPSVREWRDKVVKHEAYVKVFKGLVKIYEGNIERLSREITARQNEEGTAKLSERKA